MVVPELSILHDVDAMAADVSLAVSFLYIASLGLDVATNTHMSVVQGHPGRIPVQHCARHVPQMKHRVHVRFGERLDIEHADVRRALRRLARVLGSKFMLSKSSVAAYGGMSFESVRDVVAWASHVRRVDIMLGPKVCFPRTVRQWQRRV